MIEKVCEMKTTKMKAAIGLLAALVVSGCAGDPRSYETTPVQLKSSAGVVTCQLYTREKVLWDRSIDRPANMTVETADNLCRAEGVRQQKAS